MYTGDEDKKKKRVHKDSSDAARQKKMEGKNTAFQVALRGAEAKGGGKMMWKGKVIAAADKERPMAKKGVSIKRKPPASNTRLSMEEKSGGSTPKKAPVVARTKGRAGTYKPKFPKGRDYSKGGPIKVKKRRR